MECLGFAPDTEIYAFRVFTDAQVMLAGHWEFMDRCHLKDIFFIFIQDIHVLSALSFSVGLLEPLGGVQNIF